MIQAKNISKIYKKKGKAITAVKPCSLTLPDSGLVVIIGETGSGKSTLLSILGGMQKPDSGEISGAQNAAAFVFQNSMLLEEMTLQENIGFVDRLYPDANVNTDELLAKFGLSNRLDNYPNELSGGEKQRAALLIAMLENKPAIFADEPTGNLDEEHAEAIAKLLKELSLSRLVVVVTHDNDIFSGLADRLIKMSGGSITEDRCLAERNGVTTEKPQNYALKTPQFGIKQTATVAVSVVKKSKTRFILLAVSLLLAFLCVLTFTNNLFSREENRVYTALSSQNAVSMDFVKTDGEQFQPLKMSKSELNYYLDKYNAAYFIDNSGAYIFEKDGNALAGGIQVNRFYVNEVCNQQILAGNADLADGQIAISDYIASDICAGYLQSFGEQLGYSDLIGHGLGAYTISAVYSTGYDGREPSDGMLDAFNAQHRTVYVNDSTYTSHIPTSAQVNYNLEGMYANFVVVFSESEKPFGYELLYGSDDLAEGEVLLPEEYADDFAGAAVEDVAGLVGTQITLTFAEMSALPANQEHMISLADRQYTVAGIYSSQLSYMNLVMSAQDYPEVYLTYSNQITGSSAGISIAGCDLATIETVYTDGLTDGSFARYNISGSYGWLQTIALIAVFISAVLIIISFFILVSFINDSVAKNMRTLGVLRALGVSTAKIAGIYLLQCAVCLVAVFAAVAILQVPLVFAWNGLLAAVIEGGVPVVYYGWQAILLTAGVLVAYLFCAYAIIIARLRKKSSIELVYER